MWGQLQASIIWRPSGWIGEFDYKNRRLIVSYKADRARRDEHQRGQVVEKIKKRLGTDGATQKLITNQGVKKFTESDKSKTTVSQEKIAKDALWDGIHGIITNIKPKQTKEEEAAQAQANPKVPEEKIERADAIELIMRYGRLWKIEESFRMNKHTLSMRPIYHFKPERIKAHIALCYMAFTVLRHMEYRVRLTQKISPEVMIDELLNVQASLYRHMPTVGCTACPASSPITLLKFIRPFKLSAQIMPKK